jgi:hypothetical protein
MLAIHKPLFYHSKKQIKLFNERRYSTNYTVKLLTNKCTEVEIDKLIESRFKIDGQEVRKNSTKILINTKFSQTTALSAALVTAKYFTGFHIPLISGLAKVWFYGASGYFCSTLLLRNGNKSIRFFEPNKNFLTNYKYCQASRRILKITENELTFSVTNITPEILTNYINYYLYSDIYSYEIRGHLITLIQDNKDYFIKNFDACVKYICFSIDVFNKMKKIIFWYNPKESTSSKCRTILEILQDGCDKTIDDNLQITKDLTFSDYNKSQFEINKKNT